MLQVRRDQCVARALAEARRLASESQVTELRALLIRLRAEAGELTKAEEVAFGIHLAVSHYRGDCALAAQAELDRIRPLVPVTDVVSQAQFHATAGAVEFRLENDEAAITETVQALAAVEGERNPTDELAMVAATCALNLAHTQLFLLAAETAERAIVIADGARCSAAGYRLHAGYAYVCWAMRLQHLGRHDESQHRWQAAADHLDVAVAATDSLPQLWHAYTRADRAYCAARVGAAQEARSWLDAARQVPVRPVTPDIRRLFQHVEGAVLLAEGRYGQARAVLSAYWEEAGKRKIPPWTEDAAWLLARVAEAEGDDRTALRWYREVHERYGRAQYEVWLSRATAARLRVEQEALVRRARQLESDALSDPLTGVPNRRAFDANLPRLVEAAHAAGTPLTLAIFDVDRFKRVNDTHGHPAGDEVLRRIARILREQSRDADRCARYGGDELILCLPVATAEAAVAVGRISRSIASHPWSSVAPGLQVTVSTGLAELAPGDTATSLFWAADQSLLAAKRARARVGSTDPAQAAPEAGPAGAGSAPAGRATLEHDPVEPAPAGRDAAGRGATPGEAPGSGLYGEASEHVPNARTPTPGS